MPVRFHVFLSHNSADKPAVEELAHRLRKEGIEPWLDKWHLIPGDPWQPALEAALKDCESCAVFIGPSGIGSWQHEEMRAAINHRVRDSPGEFRVIPVVLPGGQRGERTGLPTFLEAATWVEFARSLDDEQAFHRLLCAIRRLEPGPGPGQATYEGQCPYRGLEAFHAEHQAFFFGRQALTEWLLNALRRQPGSRTENRFLAIVGASGSGKSSLALAGLAPAVQRGEMEGSADWLRAVCRPGTDPLESLAIALSNAGVIEASAGAVRRLHEELCKDERTLHVTARLALHQAPPSRRLFVLLDQFEEVFTLCPDESLRHALIANLLYAAGVAGGQVLVVLTLRADFYGKCAAYPALAAALSEHQVLVGPLTDEELRQAIEKPAQLAGCFFEPGLVDVLIDDVRHQAGALPLLQYALLELWKRRRGGRLTSADYQDIGRLEGALDRRANEVLKEFTAAEQELCRRIFLRLTQPGEGTEDTKRRVSLRELEMAGGDAPVVERVVQKLADERLITTEGEEQVEVAHEALIRGWSALRQWIEVDRAGLRTHRRLGEAAREWEASGREESFLYEGARLAVAREWAAAHSADLNQGEREFLEASVRRIEHARKRKRRLWAAALGLLVLVLVLGMGGGIVLHLWREAEGARERAEEAEQREKNARKGEAEAREQVLQAGYLNQVEQAGREWKSKEVARADQLLAGCERQRRGWEWHYVHNLCHSELLNLKGHTDGILSVAFSPDGKWLASASGDQTVKVWDVESGQETLTFKRHTGTVECVAFSPDGKRLASASEDKTVKLWDAQTGQETLSFKRHTETVYSVAFSPDGKRLASASEDKTVKVWDAQTGQEAFTLKGHTDIVTSVAFSPDGKRLASASADGAVMVWDAQTGLESYTLNGRSGPVWSVIFSPDSKRLACASIGMQGSVKVWDAQTGEEALTLKVSSGAISNLAFSPDSKRLVTASDDKLVKVWDAQTGVESLTFEGHTEKVYSVAFSPDGKRLASASADETVKVWDAEKHREGFTLGGNATAAGTSVALSPDGKRLASASEDKTVKVWNLQTGQEAFTLKGHTDIVTSVAFSPDGKRLASASADGAVMVWDAQTGLEVRTLKGHLAEDRVTKGHTSKVYSVAFSPDGKRLASASEDKTVKVWNLQTGQEAFTLKGHTDIVTSVAFSPDGKRLASASADGAVMVWDAQTGLEVRTLKGHIDWVLSLAFSPDGNRLASASDDETVKVWNLQTGQEAPTLKSYTANTAGKSVAFSPDGKRLASAGGADGMVKVWDAQSGQEARTLEGHIGAVNSVVFSPDGNRLTCASWSGTVQVWDATPHAEAPNSLVDPKRQSLSMSQKLAQHVQFPGIDDRKMTLVEALAALYRHYSLSFAVNDEAFKSENVMDVGSTEIANPEPIPAMKNVRLDTVLKTILARVPVPSGAALNVRGGHVEITTKAFLKELEGEPHSEALNRVVDLKRQSLSVSQKLVQRVQFPGIDDPKMTLSEALKLLSRRYSLSCDFNENAFKSENVMDVGSTEIASPRPIPEMKNVTLYEVLQTILARVPVPSGAALNARGGHVEITTKAFLDKLDKKKDRDPGD